MKKEVMEMLKERVLEYDLFGMDEIETANWNFETIDGTLEGVSDNGDKVHITPNKTKGNVTRYMVEVVDKNKEKHTFNSSVLVDSKNINVIESSMIYTFKDLAKAVYNMEVLVEDYRGFDYMVDSLEKLKIDLEEHVELMLFVTDTMEQFMDFIEFECDSENQFEEIMYACWDMVIEMTGKFNYEDLDYILEYRKEEKTSEYKK